MCAQVEPFAQHAHLDIITLQSIINATILVPPEHTSVDPHVRDAPQTAPHVLAAPIALPVSQVIIFTMMGPPKVAIILVLVAWLPIPLPILVLQAVEQAHILTAMFAIPVLNTVQAVQVLLHAAHAPVDGHSLMGLAYSQLLA